MDFEIEQAISEAYASAQLLQSDEADFEAKTWTFKAECFRAGAGDYVCLSKKEWERFVSAIRATKQVGRISDLEAALEHIAFQVGGGKTPHDALKDAYDRSVMTARKALGL